MKRVFAGLLCSSLLLGAASNASAIDFKGRGQWLMGFALTDTHLIHKERIGNETRKNLREQFESVQRIRLELEAAASENLSGILQIQVGNQIWGQHETGASFGGNGYEVKVRQAYLDWAIPDAALRFRMGLQSLALPNTAGGSAVLDAVTAAVSASWEITDNFGLTALWLRPLNDNFTGNGQPTEKDYLDNMDLFALAAPVKFDGFEMTPWAMLGMKGRNSMRDINSFQGFENGFDTGDGNLPFTLYPYPAITGHNPVDDMDWATGLDNISKTYGTMFWAGLPLNITAFNPLNIELDLNYGYVEAMGRFWAYKNLSRAHNAWDIERKRASTERKGWLVKALAEYSLNWAVPGIFGWYGSGDDGNPKNGSERMPSLAPCGTFTSFLGDGNVGWVWNDYALDYAGTWGIGLQVRDMAFVEDMKHTFRVAWWGGTNSTGMIKYMNTPMAWNEGWASASSPYLTTSDGLLEFNLVNEYSMYENLDINMDFGYVANYVDHSAWKKANIRNASFSGQDAWKAQLVFAYSF